MKRKKALVLLSGGLDSTVVLAYAVSRDRDCFALSFDYGQRHSIELSHASLIAERYKISHKIIKIDPQAFGNSSLVSNLSVLKGRSSHEISGDTSSNTYVPARNTLFLAYAAGQAELFRMEEIYIGANASDRAGYPDCREEFFDAFRLLLSRATRIAVEGRPPDLKIPLLHMDKAKIVAYGKSLSAPLDLSFSCYDPSSSGIHCGLCDACVLRKEGFRKSSIPDAVIYER